MGERKSKRRARDRRRGRWLGRAVAASSLICAPAQAADPSFGGGVFFGYRFGAHSGFEWGLEAFSTYRFRGAEDCTSAARTGLGPLVQIGWLGLEQPRMTLALQGGGELQRATLAVSGQLGLSYRLGPDGGFGVHSAVMPETLFVNAGLNYEWFLGQGWVGGGARVLPTYGEPSMCSVQVGRPLRTDDGLLQLPASCAPPSALVRSQRARAAIEPVGLAFERDAELEAASVPAFLLLAGELAAAHAPHALVQRALRAAADEQLHAGLTAQLAERHLGRPALVRVPEVVQRRALEAGASTVRLAIESWLDGCCAEGRAAAQAATAAERSHDVAARAVLARIAADEQRHAELAWSILEWALRAGGADARDAVHELLTADETVVDSEHAPGGLEAHGRLAADTLNAVAREHGERARARLHDSIGVST
ncbi:MAG TPA: hypothetical protein VK509_22520 [Polyangiales bacterium]|nr:hypothetical protein [Polyangiales bacterium]